MKVKKKVKSPLRSPKTTKWENDLPQLIYDETQAVNLLDDTQSDENKKPEK